MAFGDVLRTEGFTFNTNALTLTSTVAVGNTIMVFCNGRDASVAVSDDVNGSYTKTAVVQPAGDVASAVIFYVVSTSAAIAPTITITNHKDRAAACEVAGSLTYAGISGAVSGTSLSGTGNPFETQSAAIPSDSVSFGVFSASSAGSGITEDAPWLTISEAAAAFVVAHRKDTTGVTDTFSGVYNGLLATNTYAAIFGSFTAATTVPALTATLVADANDTALPAATNVNVAVLTTAWQLIGTATIGVGTDGALSITDADLTLEAGQSITSGTEYVVDIYDPVSGKQRSPRLTAA